MASSEKTEVGKNKKQKRMNGMGLSTNSIGIEES